ncbi:AAA family ATPase [Streptomyces sp. CBMA29]|uniref:AAA family ATPase n=1 Tax=Streptomyces sp. CBMA29 TaxID=1896314 RepID=UPI001661F51F|nr:AAA family ATPase [Streptomyces sp. CBMA29]MBD0737117.1 hypothetical protein [Streptomyces sp. CBMA29]
MTFITRVRIENYRSIASCDVRLGPLTVLAGPNASGKSNFLDAVRFVRDAVHTSPERALESRGGLDEVLHRSGPDRQAESFRISLDTRVLVHGGSGSEPVFEDCRYVLEIGTDPAGGRQPVVRVEEFTNAERDGGVYRTPNQNRSPTDLVLPFVARERPDTIALYNSLDMTRFYELITPVLRAVDDTPKRRGSSNLGESGERLPRVLWTLDQRLPWVKEVIDGYLRTMIDNAVGVDGIDVPEGDLGFVVGRFRNEVGDVRKVDRRSLSEGTLRLTGVLAALFQPRALNGTFPLIAIEEPEISLHPPMVGALYDALVAASRNTQVMVTTQSADLLDNAAADPAHVLVARNDGSGTVIGPIDSAGRQLVADGVLTLPELLRSGEMRPER